MNIYFVRRKLSQLSDYQPEILFSLRRLLLSDYDVRETFDPKTADVILIQENKNFKNFNYIKLLLEDPVIGKFPEKVFTINSDDSATGLLRGLYACLPSSRNTASLFKTVPYLEYPNELILNYHIKAVEHPYLATWRGNLQSNKLRHKMVKSLRSYLRCRLEWTESWLNHSQDEKEKYLSLMDHSKFSLCPAGWASATYRIYETMAMGKCPVIIADEFLPPIGPEWNSFALFFPEKKIDELYPFLLSKEHLAESMGIKAKIAWQNYFSPDRILYYYAEALLSLIESTPKTTKEKEIQRWNSVFLHRSNKWTLSQRLFKKIK